MARTLSAVGREMLKRLESLSLTAYPDGGGYSIGYGHNGAKAGQTITKDQADRLFDLDVRTAENAVNTYATQATTQPQFDALVSFTYNVGVGDPNNKEKPGFRGSTLLKLHNAGETAAAADEFDRWIYSKGKVSEALRARRNVEQDLYRSSSPAPSSSSSSLPPPPALPPLPELPPAPVGAGMAPSGEGWIWGWVLVPAFFLPREIAGERGKGDDGDGQGTRPRVA